MPFKNSRLVNAQIPAEIIGKIITGGLVRTRTSGQRWELLSDDPEGDTPDALSLRAYYGDAAEEEPGGIYTTDGGLAPNLLMKSSFLTGGKVAYVNLVGAVAGVSDAIAQIEGGDFLNMQADKRAYVESGDARIVVESGALGTRQLVFTTDNGTHETIMDDIGRTYFDNSVIVNSGTLSVLGTTNTFSLAVGFNATISGTLSCGSTLSAAAATISGPVSGTNISASGVLSGASAAITGAITGASLTATGTVQGNVVNGTSDVRINGASIPRGEMDYAAITAVSATTTTTILDVAGLDVTATLVSGRRYKITVDVGVRSSVAGDRETVYIRQGTTTIAFSQSGAIAAANSQEGFHLEYRFTASSSGSRTFKVSINRTSGTGNVALFGSATAPSFIAIDDLGV